MAVALAWAALLLAPLTAPAAVVINEVMYHPPDDRDDLQWVELLNTGPAPVNLQGWSFKQGFKFVFTNETVLKPGAFLIVSRDRGAFRTRYGREIPVLGDFNGRLSHSGERLELADSAGKVVDTIAYADEEPWPTSPDGMSTSLERIVATGPGDNPANWAPSPMPATRGAAGTPGRTNDAARPQVPPGIEEVRFAPPPPGQPLAVTATLTSPHGIASARLLYRVLSVADTVTDRPRSLPEEREIPLARTSGDARRGTWSADIPSPPDGQLVRFRIEATDGTRGVRQLPHPHDSRPAWSWFVTSNTNPASIPIAHVLQFGPTEDRGSSLRTEFGPRRGARSSAPTEPARGEATLIYLPTEGGAVQIFDFIRVTPRQGGWKVRLQKDRLLDGISTFNVIFEFQPRYVLAEHLAYELYRAAGVPAPLSGHWRVWYNAQPVGYHLFVEQPNATFLRRTGHDPDGDLYKLLWYGGKLVGQHEKKNNPDSGHTALVQLVEGLQSTRGDEQWRLIERHVDVEAFVNYYAVNMCLQNWDGFFNNYFVYRAPGPQGKWAIIPWDEDKTWGDYDGASPAYDWYTMPLDMGMNGSAPSRSAGNLFGGGGPFGGTSWWRPPGWFSGPLLAHPRFRERFLTRLKEICDTVFTPEKWEPIFADLERRLEPEVRYRATVVGRQRNTERPIDYAASAPPRGTPSPNPDAALEQFRGHIASFRNQVRHRREFILRELAQGR